MKKLKIAVIGGGSSYTPELIDGFIKRKKELKVEEIHLVDIEEGFEKLEIVSNLAKRMIKKAGMNTKITYGLNRREAIEKADFVVTQIRVGGLKARENDEKIPLKHRLIGQETTGAGGFSKALRTIPVILDICKDIEELSKDAWLINFTNPAGIVTEAVKKHTNVKVLGLCNVPIGTRNRIADMLSMEKERVFVDFAGLNHMVWGTNVYIDGKKATKEVIEKLIDGESITMKNIPDLKWDSDFIKAFNMVPCPYHRYYYMTQQMIEDEIAEFEKTSYTRAVKVMDIEKELFECYRDENLNQKPAQLENRGGAYYSDAAVSLINSIANDKRDIHTVNVLNKGAISNFSKDVVVEVNCLVGKNGATPLEVGELKPEVTGLMEQVKAYEILTIEAAIERSYHKALKALMLNPLVKDVALAKNVLNDILEANKDYINLEKE